MSAVLEALVLASPLALLALVIFRSGRGRDPGDISVPERKPEDETARARRQNGDGGGGYIPPVTGGDDSGNTDCSGGDGGGGGGD